MRVRASVLFSGLSVWHHPVRHTLSMAGILVVKISDHSIKYDYALLKYYGVMQFIGYEPLHSEAVTEPA